MWLPATSTFQALPSNQGTWAWAWASGSGVGDVSPIGRTGESHDAVGIHLGVDISGRRGLIFLEGTEIPSVSPVAIPAGRLPACLGLAKQLCEAACLAPGRPRLMACGDRAGQE